MAEYIPDNQLAANTTTPSSGSTSVVVDSVTKKLRTKDDMGLILDYVSTTDLENSPVITKLLTGYISGTGTISATDSILTAIQKLNGNITNSVTLMTTIQRNNILIPTIGLSIYDTNINGMMIYNGTLWIQQ